MASSVGDFDDAPDEGFTGPLLPPEDRLWRHPSELGGGNVALPLDAVAIRRRWLNHQPSRASAWTAGLVGAILATGLVALGTHLAGAFAGHSVPPAVPQTSTNTLLGTSAVPRSVGLGATLVASITAVGSSVATIDVMHGTSDRRCLGLVVRADGMIVAPAAYVQGATSMLVTFSDEVPYVATLVASDPQSGIAVLHINGASNLTALRLGSKDAVQRQSLAIAVTAPGGGTYVLGALQGLDSAQLVHGAQLTDVIRTDLPAGQAPVGSALIDADGAVVGMVAGSSGGMAVAVPSWLAGPVVDQLIDAGRVAHGTLGVTGQDIPRKEFQPAGVLITNVTPGSAAGIAGLRVGDIITSVNFQPVVSLVGLRGHLYGLGAGKEVMIGIDRGTTDLFYVAYLQAPDSDAPASATSGVLTAGTTAHR